MGLKAQTRGVLVALILGYPTLALASWFSKAPHRPDCNPSSITQKEVPNFHYVDNDLYRGGRPSCAGLLKLEALGIRTFVDMGGGVAGTFPHCEGAESEGAIRVIRFKIDLPHIVIFGVSDRRLRELFSLMREAPKPIFLSCSLGRDRTGLIVALYRMKRGEMSYPEARQEAIYYGYRPSFIGLRKALERYQEPRELRLLPAPSRTQAPPETVCRAKDLLTTAREF